MTRGYTNWYHWPVSMPPPVCADCKKLFQTEEAILYRRTDNFEAGPQDETAQEMTTGKPPRPMWSGPTEKDGQIYERVHLLCELKKLGVAFGSHKHTSSGAGDI